MRKRNARKEITFSYLLELLRIPEEEEERDYDWINAEVEILDKDEVINKHYKKKGYDVIPIGIIQEKWGFIIDFFSSHNDLVIIRLPFSNFCPNLNLDFLLCWELSEGGDMIFHALLEGMCKHWDEMYKILRRHEFEYQREVLPVCVNCDISGSLGGYHALSNGYILIELNEFNVRIDKDLVVSFDEFLYYLPLNQSFRWHHELSKLCETLYMKVLVHELLHHVYGNDEEAIELVVNKEVVPILTKEG